MLKSNKWSLFAVVSLLSVLSVPALGTASDVLGAKESPLVKPQYLTPWCFAMAARAQLDQLVCESQGCKAGESGIAVASLVEAHRKSQNEGPMKSIIESSPAQFWFQGGDPAETLEQVRKERRIARASCTSEPALFRFHQDPKIGTGLPMSFQLLGVYEGFQSSLKNPASDPKASQAARAREWLSAIAKSQQSDSMMFLEKALAESGSSDEFLKKVLSPSECQSNAILLPRFRVLSFEETDFQKIETRIEEGLKKGRIVSVGLCAYSLADKAATDCGPHAVAISQVGPKGYRVLDSSFFAKAARNPDDCMWLSKELVINAMLAHTVFLSGASENLTQSQERGRLTLQAILDKYIRESAQILWDLKVRHQKEIEDFQIKMRESFAAQKAQIEEQYTPDQIRKIIRSNPAIKKLFQPAELEKYIQDKAREITAQNAEKVKEYEKEDAESLNQMKAMMQKAQINFALSQINVTWIERE